MESSQELNVIFSISLPFILPGIIKTYDSVQGVQMILLHNPTYDQFSRTVLGGSVPPTRNRLRIGKEGSMKHPKGCCTSCPVHCVFQEFID